MAVAIQVKTMGEAIHVKNNNGQGKKRQAGYTDRGALAFELTGAVEPPIFG